MQATHCWSLDGVWTSRMGYRRIHEKVIVLDNGTAISDCMSWNVVFFYVYWVLMLCLKKEEVSLYFYPQRCLMCKYWLGWLVLMRKSDVCNRKCMPLNGSCLLREKIICLLATHKTLPEAVPLPQKTYMSLTEDVLRYFKRRCTQIFQQKIYSIPSKRCAPLQQKMLLERQVP